MMNIYLTIAIVLANLIGIVIVYQFVKKLDKKERIIFIAVGIATMYILVSIVYWISGFGIAEDVHKASKNFVLYLFVPVNTILTVPYIASKYTKFRKQEVDIQYLANKVSTIAVLLIIVLVVEYFYFRNIQKNITDINTAINETHTQEIIKDDNITN